MYIYSVLVIKYDFIYKGVTEFLVHYIYFKSQAVLV